MPKTRELIVGRRTKQIGVGQELFVVSIQVLFLSEKGTDTKSS